MMKDLPYHLHFMNKKDVNCKWAVTWQNQQSECVPSEDSDQPGHPPSLIRIFAVRMKKAWVLSYPLSTQRRLWSDWVDAQADLSLHWAHSHFVSFVMSRLKYLCIIFKHKSINHFIGTIFGRFRNVRFESNLYFLSMHPHPLHTHTFQNSQESEILAFWQIMMIQIWE